jgi:hypothetical protein
MEMDNGIKVKKRKAVWGRRMNAGNETFSPRH